MNKIKKIIIGAGEGAGWFETRSKQLQKYYYHVDEIKEEMKQIAADKFITVYRAYKGGNIVMEVEAGSQIQLIFDPPQESEKECECTAPTYRAESGDHRCTKCNKLDKNN